jgi:hypothetical protein
MRVFTPCVLPSFPSLRGPETSVRTTA